MSVDILEVCAGCGAGLRNREGRYFKCPKCGGDKWTDEEYQGLVDIFDFGKLAEPEPSGLEDVFVGSEVKRCPECGTKLVETMCTVYCPNCVKEQEKERQRVKEEAKLRVFEGIFREFE